MRLHSYIWLLIIGMLLLMAPLFVAPGGFRASIEADVRSAVQWYGESETVILLHHTNAIYHTVMGKTGIDEFIKTHYTGGLKPEDTIGVLITGRVAEYAGLSMGYWEGLLNNIYMFFLRLATAWMWLCYLSPFLVAIAFDGAMTRKAKRESFRYTSPTVYNVSWHLAIFVVFLSLLIFALPAPLNIFYYPVVITMCGVLARLVIGNIQYSA